MSDTLIVPTYRLDLPALPMTAYLLPEAGPDARQDFLSLLHSPGETWISAYGFTLQEMFEEIKAADANGIPVHILLDHTQATGHAEAPLVKDLAGSLVHGDVTITTAGIGSASKSAIWHCKGMVVAPVDGGEAHCWSGSVNFSASGWDQGNHAFRFRCDAWATAYIAQFLRHRQYAREFEPQYQVVTATTVVIATQG